VGVTARAVLRVRDEKGLHSREVPLGEGRGMVIPGATVTYRSLFPSRPPPGVYIAEATLDYEGLRPSVTKCTFSVAQDGRLTLGALQSVATVGLGVTPRTIDVSAARRSTRVLSVTLHNVEDYPIKVSSGLLRLGQSADGRYLTDTGGGEQPDYSWIRVDPEVLEIPAGTRKRVKVTLSIPEDARPSEYVRVALTPDAPELSDGMLQETYSTDLFIKVPPGLRDSLAVKSLSVARAKRFAPTEVTFEVTNLGDCHVDIDALATIKVATGKNIKDLRLADRDTRILPGVTRRFTIPDPQGLEAGEYTCELRVMLGTKNAGYKSANFRISG